MDTPVSFETLLLFGLVVVPLWLFMLVSTVLSALTFYRVRKVDEIEQRLILIDEQLAQYIPPQSHPSFGTPVFRSLDGRHEAASFEELAQKMMNDPNPNDQTDLKKFFEDMKDAEDDDDKPWEKS